MAETEWDFRSVGPDEMQLDTIPGVPDAVRAAEGTDELREALRRYIADTCAVWEVQFDAGPGPVVSLSDASFAAAKFIEARALNGESRG